MTVGLDTTTVVADIRRITRDRDAAEVATAAYEQMIRFLEELEPTDWTSPTECTGWDVAAMVGHVIGAAKSCASMREAVRQQLHGARHAGEYGGNSLDAGNALQVREHAHLTPTDRIAELRRLAPAAVRGRMRLPGPLRRISLPMDQGGSTAEGMPARFRLGDLMDVIYTRDVWLHTVDIARATSRAHPADAELDRRIVADVVAEWANRHGQPFELTLTGPVAGRYRHGSDGASMRLDAIEYCRVLSGRAEPDEVGADLTPDAVALLRTRLLF
ncbi:maleylpyruvate isomerase family mycothiol-dependent enzyme [Egicoccus sp. AB-alg6-2]|uniref:maleylpyruvate isomerase family mycothiol-dependent enzyme n=1 Tax=Egicoccus sp. AB-alg6-2 TaxID=3242692 RepID=UPI00359D933E